nr:PREDICTED: switch-associated protein 70-like [Paralichthys olivaceus]
MVLREELLKSIWHAFTALDVDHRGKVSKSQLKVLSHNLCTVMKIPHDPVALEEHFQDNDEGPLSNEGYMPYLNRFILDKVREDFDVQDFNKMCWTLCFMKKICTKHLLITQDDAFKVWCIFNFLSEDKYPLVIVIEEIEYFLRKLLEAMGSEWSEEKFADYKLQLSTENCLTAWELIELVGLGYFSKGMNQQTLSLGINEVYQELILDVLKQGHLHLLDDHILVTTPVKQRGDTSFYFCASQKMEEAAAKAALEESRRNKTQLDLQDRYRMDLEREKMVHQQMEEQVAQKSSELEQYLQRVRELEDMYHRLEEALEDERQAKQDEEAMRKLQARLLEEEATKRAELELIHLQQQRALSQTEAEKQELVAQQQAKERELQTAMLQLESLQRERQGALEQYEEVSRKLEGAANKTKTWKDKVAKHEGLVRLIQPGDKAPQRITNWGPASFTDAELEMRKKSWQERKNQGPQAQ